MGSTAGSSALTEAITRLLDRDQSLQVLVLDHVSAIAPDGITAVPAPPLWSHPTGHPPLPHDMNAAGKVTEHRPWPQNNVEVRAAELLLTLDMFAVAQSCPECCCLLLSTPRVVIDPSATTAVNGWIRRYVRQQCEASEGGKRSCTNGRDIDRAAEPGSWSDGFQHSSCVPPPRWWTAISEAILVLEVRVLLLRTPTFLATVASCGSGADGDTLQAPADSAAALQPMHRASAELSCLSCISPLSLEDRRLPSVPTSHGDSSTSLMSSQLRHSLPRRLSAALPAYPADAFLEAAHVVHIIGVVHQIFFASRSATQPAPWVTVLLLPPSSASSSSSSQAAQPIRRREVSLTELTEGEVRAVAVIGAVVEVRGHTQVARAAATARGGAPGKGSGDAVLQEYIVADWAVPVSPVRPPRPAASRDAAAVGGTLQRRRSCDSSPVATTAALPHTPFDPHTVHGGIGGDRPLAEAQWPPFPAGVSEGDWADSLDGAAAVAELTGWEEESAARVALACWEGTRLAVGLAAQDRGPDSRACVATAHFSATLDAVLAAQLALYSAHLRDGVVALLVDGAANSFVGQLLAAIGTCAPAAVLEVPPSAMKRAQPSFFLPSYCVQHVVPPPPPPLPAPQQQQQQQQPRQWQAAGSKPGRAARRCEASDTVGAAPPPPSFREVLKGGALSHACGRALVLHGIEALSVSTLQVLQEALRTTERDGSGSAGDDVDRATHELACSSMMGKAHGGSSPQPAAAGGGGGGGGAAGTARHTIQRESGQLVKYRVTQAALCSVRNGARLADKTHLFEFSQRCDVVVRLTYDRKRQATALQAELDDTFQPLFSSRREMWLAALGDTFALPMQMHAASRPDESAPTLTEACNRLLSSYFIAAKALCAEGTDAAMMTTLVKLTLAHAQWRQGMTRALRQRCPPRCTGALAEETVAAEAPSATGTALVDAVVAVGLCDATLHFFTARTLLGECVLGMLEREAWPTWEAEAERAESREGAEGDGVPSASPYHTASWAALPPDLQAFYRQVEFRTRWPAEWVSAGAAVPSLTTLSAFSIQQLVSDLLEHLAHITQSAAPTTGAP